MDSCWSAFSSCSITVYWLMALLYVHSGLVLAFPCLLWSVPLSFHRGSRPLLALLYSACTLQAFNLRVAVYGRLTIQVSGPLC